MRKTYGSSYIVADAVAVVAIVATAILTYHGNVSSTTFTELVTLCLGFVFGRQVGSSGATG